MTLTEVTPKGKRKSVKQYFCYQCRGRFAYGARGNPEALVVETEHKCEKCSSALVKRKGRYGEFLACSGYPKCKNILKIDKAGNPVVMETKAVQVTNQCCPKCGSVMIVRAKGEEKFLGCSRYPSCRTTSKWQEGIQIIDELSAEEVKKRYKQVKKKKKT